MNFINLTPHRINETTTGKSFDPSGDVARVACNMTENGSIEDIPVFVAVYGEVEGLPSPVENTTYIVSGLVQSAVKDRSDVVSPGELVRDEAGKPIGCRGFKRG